MDNKYKEKLDNIEFSFSSLNQHDHCGFAFYLNKICEEDKEGNAYGEIGKYGHELNERIFKHDITVQEALNDCIENFDDHVFSYIHESSKTKKYMSLCEYLADFDDFYEEKYEVIGVEVEFHWKIGRYKCVGYADLILRDRHTGQILLVDHKSAPHFMKKNGTPLKNQIENFNAYSKQMYIYADAMKKKYGYFPDFLLWSHFLDSGETTVIPFNEQDYKNTIKWVKKKIREIYADRKFEAKDNYMLCNQLCDFRNSCEYRMMRSYED